MNTENTTASPMPMNGATVAPANQMDDLSFGLLMNRTLGGSESRRPSDKSANDVQVDIILGQAQNLAKMNDQYVETYVVRGTKELYALLGAIYSYALQINESPLRDHILQRMREKLESEHDIKTQANTPWITTVLRFILPTDRQTAYNYSKVLQVAHDENLAPQELPGYIKERGGIAKITATKEDAEAAKALKTHKEAKTQMLRKILLANAKASTNVVQVEDKFILNTVDEDKKEGVFEFAVCVNTSGQERRIVRFIKLNEAMEAQILNMVAETSLPDDLAEIQDKLDQFRESWASPLAGECSQATKAINRQDYQLSILLCSRRLRSMRRSAHQLLASRSKKLRDLKRSPASLGIATPQGDEHERFSRTAWQSHGRIDEGTL